MSAESKHTAKLGSASEFSIIFIALMFVVFDIETVFLYPWAVSYAGLGGFALLEMAVFLFILFAGLAYAWAKGVLRWV